MGCDYPVKRYQLHQMAHKKDTNTVIKLNLPLSYLLTMSLHTQEELHSQMSIFFCMKDYLHNRLLLLECLGSFSADLEGAFV